MTKLTKSQQTVLKYLRKGFTQATIAQKMGIDYSSVVPKVLRLKNLGFIRKIDRGRYEIVEVDN